jgi:hypothetical protein
MAARRITPEAYIAQARARVARAMEQLEEDRAGLAPFVEHAVELKRALLAYYRRLPAGKFGGDPGAADLYWSVDALLSDAADLGEKLAGEAWLRRQLDGLGKGGA